MGKGFALFLVLAVLSILVARLGCARVGEAQSGGVIQGQVVNKSQGGGDVSGLRVVLHQERDDQHMDVETITGEEGHFRFEGIALSPNVLYGVSVTYQGAPYGVDVGFGGSTDPVQLTVYEGTDSHDVLITTLSSVLLSTVDKATQRMRALEIITMVNISDRTYVPGPEPMKLLRFSLPQGARDLQVQSSLQGADVLQVDKGFALTGAIPPGEHDFMFAYTVRYEGGKFTFIRSLPFGARQLRVLFPVGDSRLSSPQLGPSEEVNIGNRRYQLLSAFDLPPGARVTVDLTGLPVASLLDRVVSTARGVPFQYVAPAALGLLLVFLLAYATLRRRWRTKTMGVGDEVVGDRGALLSALVQLDREWELGHLAQGEYRRRRQQFTQALLAASSTDSPGEH